MRYLAIDPGGKRTGVAVGDDVTGIVSPLEVITAAKPAHRLDQLAALIEREGPDELVVGLPMHMDGREGPAAAAARDLGQRLSRRVERPVRFHDERLSSSAADEQMARSGLTHGGKKARRDAVAAAVILRDFLHAQQNADRADDV